MKKDSYSFLKKTEKHRYITMILIFFKVYKFVTYIIYGIKVCVNLNVFMYRSSNPYFIIILLLAIQY